MLEDYRSIDGQRTWELVPRYGEKDWTTLQPTLKDFYYCDTRSVYDMTALNGSRGPDDDEGGIFAEVRNHVESIVGEACPLERGPG
jgi:hypothetical protein